MLKHNLLALSLDRALQLSTAALAVMGSLFLALGHESPVIPLLLAVAAVASVWFTDVLGKVRLNRLLGNLIAIVGVCWSLRNFFSRIAAWRS